MERADAMVRGQFTAACPCFFLDLSQSGLNIVLRNILGLIVGFGVMGLILPGLSHVLPARSV